MNAEELLKKGLSELDIPATEDQISAFITYLSELKKWNRAYNLTALKSDRDIIIKHFHDSLLYLKGTPEGSLKIADAGSGAGFPGIPIKIIRPETDITLIDSSKKKAVFLRHMIRLLKLNRVVVIEKRIEELGEEYRKYFDVVSSRATFKIKDFLEKACPYVKKSGLLLLSKGPKVSEEVGEIPETDEVVKKILNYNLPLIRDERNLIILRCGH